jgi:hypothetical protein
MYWSHRAGLGAALLAATTLYGVSPASAQTTTYTVPQGANVIIAPTPPPAPQVEVVPPAPTVAPGMAWQQGQWVYSSGNWVWQPGQYVARPQGYSVWQPGQWMQQPDGRYVWNPGHWS